MSATTAIEKPPEPSTSPAAHTDSNPVTAFRYPFAAAPDIIRSNQKDAYFQGVLLEQLSTILRKVYGARILHKYSLEAKTFTDLLYLSLTTLRNVRTLGEEYCDIIHVESDTLSLPTLQRRVGFIFTTILFPYFLTKSLPKLRARLRQKLSAAQARENLTTEKHRHPSSSSYVSQLRNYVLSNLDTLTSSENILAVHLGLFYFSGAYYHLSKRLWGLRYIFTKRLLPHEQRVGYEVLGILLLAQLATQGYFHVSSIFSNSSSSNQEEEEGGTTVTMLSKEKANPNYDNDIGKDQVRFNLENDKTMGFMVGEIGRKCTLCLELMKDPTATGCGHVFCWTCISEWCRSKPECPLCRQSALVQHLLPLRG